MKFVLLVRRKKKTESLENVIEVRISGPFLFNYQQETDYIAAKLVEVIPMNNRLFFAKTFARERHGKQMYGEFPYFVHLDAVAKLLNRLVSLQLLLPSFMTSLKIPARPTPNFSSNLVM